MSTNSKVLDYNNHELSDFPSGIVAVKMYATWCGPCKAMNAEYEKLEGATLASMDVEAGNPLITELRIRSVPTTVIFKDGEVKERVVGNDIPGIASAIAKLTEEL